MAKLKLEKNGINSVYNSFNDTISDLQKCCNLADSLSVPHGFKYRSYTKDLSSEISRIKSMIKSHKEWLESSIKKVDNLMDELDRTVSNLEIVKIRERKNIVRVQ